MCIYIYIYVYLYHDKVLWSRPPRLRPPACGVGVGRIAAAAAAAQE